MTLRDGIESAEASDAAEARRRIPEFRGALQALVRECERADFRNFRTLSGDRVWQQFVARASLPVAARLTADALALFERLSGLCRTVVEEEASPPCATTSTLPPAFLSFEASMDSAVNRLTPASSVAALDDIVFLVLLELRQRSERLRRLTERSAPLAILGESDSALRRIRKACGAVDAALSAFDGQPASLQFASELADSLAVRRVYARFRAFVASSRVEDPESLVATLRSVAARLDVLADSEVASRLRVRDRLQIIELRERVIDWLAIGEGRRVLDGERLWQDIVGFSEMLALVNRRQELVDHDRAVCRCLVSDLESLSVERRRELLDALVGLDPQLDVLVGSLESAERSSFEQTFVPILRRLGLERASA